MDTTSRQHALQLDLFPDPRTPLLQRLHGAFRQRLTSFQYDDQDRSAHEETRREWRDLREALAGQIIGHEELIDELALVALIHLHSDNTAQRILLCGPPGVGKTHTARVLAEVTGCPFRLQDAQVLTESGWQGVHLEDMLSQWCIAHRGSLHALEYGVLCLDEIDKVRMPVDDSGRVIEKRRGEQAALLPLLGTGVPVSVGTEGDQLRTENLLVILTGAFSDTPWGPHRAPTPQELVDAGYLPELVDRISQIIWVPPQPPELLARVYAEGPTSVNRREVELAAKLGYTLEIALATYRYVAVAVRSSGAAVGQRSGGHWIAVAARAALVRALREGLPSGSVVRVAPDDVRLPTVLRKPLPGGNRDAGESGEPTPSW